MGNNGSLSPLDDWNGYYRGFQLKTNKDKDIYWQRYKGTEKLYLNKAPEEIIELILKLDPQGRRFYITEENDVLTKVENDNKQVKWLGKLELDGNLQSSTHPNQTIPVQPENLSSGGLWPSVYDGSKFSYNDKNQILWDDKKTGQKYIKDPLPNCIYNELQNYKPEGGRIRITPSRDIITVISSDTLSRKQKNQYKNLPNIIKNHINQLKKNNWDKTIPIYIGNITE